MSPRPLYCHYAQSAGEEPERLTALVREAVDPKAIFLLGTTRLSRSTGSVFTASCATATHTSHYYILVLVAGDDARALNGVQDKIENNLQHFIPVTALVLGTEGFTQWLQTGHYFACQVVQKALSLYRADDLVLPPPAPPDEEARRRENACLYAAAKSKVEAFLAGADLYRIRKEHKLAAFMLHQAAEQALGTLLVTGTGFKAATHSIDKLLRYCSLFCHPLPDLFPKEAEKDKKLYGLLQRAYIDARYRNDYTISGEELAALTGKLKKLQALFHQYGCITD